MIWSLSFFQSSLVFDDFVDKYSFKLWLQLQYKKIYIVKNKK